MNNWKTTINVKNIAFILLAWIGLGYEFLQYIFGGIYAYIMIALCAVLFVVCLIQSLSEQRILGILLALIPVAFIWMGLSMSNFRSQTIYLSVLYFCCFMVFFLRNDLNLNTGEKIFRIYRLIFVIGMLGVALQILFPSFYQSSILSGYSSYDQVNMSRFLKDGLWFGFMNNPAKLAALAIYILPCAFFKQTDNKKNRADWLLIAFCYLVIFMTRKRSFLLFSIAALYFVSIQYAPSKDRLLQVLKHILIGVAAVVAVDIVLGVANGKGLWTFVADFLELNSKDISTSRFDYWREAWELFLENPLFGIGWTNFKNVIGAGLQATLMTNHVHNIYIQLLCETGIVGSVIFIGMMAYAFIHTAKNIKLINYMIDNDTANAALIEQRTLMLRSIFIQVFFLLYGLTGNPLYDVLFFVPYVLACVQGCKQVKKAVKKL